MRATLLAMLLSLFAVAITPARAQQVQTSAIHADSWHSPGHHFHRESRVRSVSISPKGAALKSGSSIRFHAICTYWDHATDDCSAAGGAKWSASRPTVASISDAGLFTEIVPPAWKPSTAYALGALVTDTNGYIEQAAVAGTSGSSIAWPASGDQDNSSSGGTFAEQDYFTDLQNNGVCPCGVVDGGVQWNLVGTTYDESFAVVSVQGETDKAAVYRQLPGDTWYQYPTPDYRSYKDTITHSPLPLNLAVGSTVTMGSGVVLNDPNEGDITGLPYQDSCNWTSSDPSVAVVDRHGQTTGLSPGTTNITCAREGDAVFGTSTATGWVSPGNVITLNVVQGDEGHATWYVLPGGGTLYSSSNPNGQCDGRANRTYAQAGGFGVDRACAVGNLRDLWADGVTEGQMKWVISGGDTVIVAPNPSGYNTGLDGPSANGWNPVNCTGTRFGRGCMMPSIPSGTIWNHTRILGSNYRNCEPDAAKTLLHVSYGGNAAFNVRDSQFVDVACFEITDQAQCTGEYAWSHANRCNKPVDNYGQNGIVQSALTSYVRFDNIFIHGLGEEGVVGAAGVGVVYDHLHLRGLPIGGFDMDDGPWSSGNISVAGGLTMINSTTEFTGCVEEYPVVHQYPYVECRDQKTGGYGDGLGTGSDTGDWYFDHDVWQYNYQDGLDLLHSGLQHLTVANSLSRGNEGQSFKIGSAEHVLFYNNIAISDCFRLGELFGDEPASALAPGGGAPGNGYGLCRAGGNLNFEYVGLGTYRFLFNTIEGTNNNDTPVGLGCNAAWDSCSTAKAVFRNNLERGYLDILNTKAQDDGTIPALIYVGNADLVHQSYQNSTVMPPHTGFTVRDHNLFFGVRNGTGGYETGMNWCPPTLGVGETCNTLDPLFKNPIQSPILTEPDFDSFDTFIPSSNSPAKGAGISIPWIRRDFYGKRRSRTPTLGAIE